MGVELAVAWAGSSDIEMAALMDAAKVVAMAEHSVVATAVLLAV